MNEAEKRRFTIMCWHDFRPASDLPANKWRCVKCAEAGIMDSIQTQNLDAADELLMRSIHRNNVLKSK